MNIHKEKEVETTKSSYNRAWGTTDLIDNKGIKLPSDLNKKTKIVAAKTVTARVSISTNPFLFNDIKSLPYLDY